MLAAAVSQPAALCLVGGVSLAHQACGLACTWRRVWPVAWSCGHDMLLTLDYGHGLLHNCYIRL